MSTPIERRVHNGRHALNTENPETLETEAGWAEVAYESIRALNHITINQASIPAPVAYRLLGNLAGVAGMLPQLTQQLTAGLAASLEDNTLEVYDSNRDPAESVAMVQDLLQTAERHAEDLAAALSAAQEAINAQGYNELDAPAPDLRPDFHFGTDDQGFDAQPPQ